MTTPKRVYTYRIRLDMEVSVEAENEEEACEALDVYRDHQHLEHDAIDITLEDIVEVEDFQKEPGIELIKADA